MHVLHYSFSLSACPKCHLLVCQHTSLANLDLNPSEETSPCTLNRGMNLYLLPSSTTSEQNYSWTTSGTSSSRSVQTLDQCSSENETICDNIPFADEPIVDSNSSVFRAPISTLVRTQSERCSTDFKPRISITRSLSFSTSSPSSSSSSWQRDQPLVPSASNVRSSSFKSFLLLLILILSFLVTNTIDIVLLYIYYQKNWTQFLLLLAVLLTCDMLFWFNHLIDWKQRRSRILFLPLTIRFYLLYQLVDSITLLFEKTFLRRTDFPRSTRSSSSASSMTITATLDTRLSPTIESSIGSHQHPSGSNSIEKRLRQRFFHQLALFCLIHSASQSLINLYMWTNQFDTTNKNWFLPLGENLLAERTIRFWSPVAPAESDDATKPLPRRTFTSNWTNSFFDPTISAGLPLLPSSSSFIFTSIFYHLIVNFSFLPTFLEHSPSSRFLLLLLSTVSRLWLMIPRLYALLFLFRFNSLWFSGAFLLIHLALVATLFFDRSKTSPRRPAKLLQIVLAIFITNSADDRSIDVLIALENLSIFLHRLYLENFPYVEPTTRRLFIFLAILIALQVIGFLFDICTKKLRTRMIKREAKV